MGYNKSEKVRIKFEFLRLLLKLELDPARQTLVAGIFEKYHTLNTEEELELSVQLKQISKDEVNQIMELMTSWEKKGLEKGIEEGVGKVAKQMLIKGFLVKDIREVTGLTEAEIEKLKDQGK